MFLLKESKIYINTPRGAQASILEDTQNIYETVFQAFSLISFLVYIIIQLLKIFKWVIKWGKGTDFHPFYNIKSEL